MKMKVGRRKVKMTMQTERNHSCMVGVIAAVYKILMYEECVMHNDWGTCTRAGILMIN